MKPKPPSPPGAPPGALRSQDPSAWRYGTEAWTHQLLSRCSDVPALAQQLRSPEVSLGVLRLSLQHFLQQIFAPVQRLAGLLLALHNHRL